MFKRMAWLFLLLMTPAVSRAAEQAAEGEYYPPQSAKAPDLDTAPNDLLNRNVRILRTTNKAQLNRYVPKVYSLRNVNPFAVLRYIQNVIRSEDGAVFTFVSPDGNGGRILVAVPEYQIPSLDDLIRNLDRPGMTSNDGTRRIYRQLKHRRANISEDPLLDDSSFIQQFAIYLTDNGSFVAVDPEQNAVFIEDAPSGADYLDAALTDKLDVPTPEVVLNTKIYELDMTNNSRIGLDYMAWKNGPGAALFSGGAFAEYGSSTISKGSLEILTSDPNLSNSNGISVIPPTDTNPSHSNRGNFESNGYNFSYRYEMSSAFFDFLAVRGKGRLLNSGRAAVLSTRSASLTAGDQILYYHVNASDPSGVRTVGQPFSANDSRTVKPNNPQSTYNNKEAVPELLGGRYQTVYNYEEGHYETIFVQDPDTYVSANLDVTVNRLTPVDTGLKINLTPLIYDNGLDLTIEGVVSDYNGFNDSGAPRINSRSFASRIRMAEGQETVLGGLTREAQIKAAPKIPVLGSLPGVGYLFGGENSSRRKTEIVVAVKAEDIVQFDSKNYGITPDDQSIIKQGEGSEAIKTPPTTWGFDQTALDKSKESYSRVLDHYKN